MSEDKQKYRCRLVPNGVVPLGKKGEAIHIIRNLTRHEADEELHIQKPGSVILRIDSDAFRNGQKNISLIVSYKFKTSIFHRTLSTKVTAKPSKKGGIACRADPKQFKILKVTTIDFLKKLVKFVSGIVRNKNWIERELQSDEIERLLSFSNREFIIIPNRDRIAIIRKTHAKERLKELSVIIDFEKPGFCALKASGPDWGEDFNNILLAFLETEPDKSNSLLIFRALGYDLEKFREEMENDERMTNLSCEQNSRDTQDNSIDDHQRAAYLSVIELELETMESTKLDNYPQEVLEPLIKVAAAVKALNEPTVDLNVSAETQSHQVQLAKKEWIKHGIFRTMFKIFRFCGKTNFPKRYDYPVEICQNLLVNFQTGCRAFHATFWKVLEDVDFGHLENYTGMFYALTKVINVDPLGSVFLKESGISRLLSLYSAISNLDTKRGPKLIASLPEQKEAMTKQNIIFNAKQIAFNKAQDKQKRTSSSSRHRRNSSPTAKKNSGGFRSPNKSPRGATVVRTVRRASGVVSPTLRSKISQRSISTSPRGEYIVTPNSTTSPSISPRNGSLSPPGTPGNEDSSGNIISISGSPTTLRKRSSMRKAFSEYPSTSYRGSNPDFSPTKIHGSGISSQKKILINSDQSEESQGTSETTEHQSTVEVMESLPEDGKTQPDSKIPQNQQKNQENSSILFHNNSENIKIIPDDEKLEPDDTDRKHRMPSGLSTSLINPLSPVKSPRILRGTTGFKLNLASSVSSGPLSPKVMSPTHEREPSHRTVSLPGQLTPKRGPGTALNSYRPTTLSDFKDLVKKIGETYVSADLTTLLSFKYEADRNKKKNQGATTQETTRLRRIDEEKKKEEEIVDEEKKWREKPDYKIKCDILVSLAVVSSATNFKHFARNPVNLLYTELIYSYSHPIPLDDSHNYIYPVLSNIAEFLEIEHRARWAEMPSQRKRNFRQKMDLLLWRIRTRLIAECLMEDIKGIAVELRILCDYLSHCRTRVMATQVADVCLDILLKIKSFIVLGPYMDVNHMENLELSHVLIRTFDLLAERNLFAPLNDMLLTIFVSKFETFDWIETYATVVLTNDEFEAKVIQQYSAKYLSEIRLQVLSHYVCCVEMIQKQFNTAQDVGASTKLELIQKLEFLIYPNTGIIQRVFTKGPSFPIAKMMLKFLHKLLFLREKDSPILSDACVDSYISFHYLHFLRLYHNYSIDEETLVLCRKHLRILCDFAMQKNEKIKQKFYQLKVMSFMTREINLEYEVKIMCRNFLEDLARQKKEEEEKKAQDLAKLVILPGKVTEDKRKSKKVAPKKLVGKKALKLNLSSVPLKGGESAALPSSSSDEEEDSDSEPEEEKPKPTLKSLKINIIGLEKGGANPKKKSESVSSESEDESSEESSVEEVKKPILQKLNISGLEKGGPTPPPPKKEIDNSGSDEEGSGGSEEEGSSGGEAPPPPNLVPEMKIPNLKKSRKKK